MVSAANSSKEVVKFVSVYEIFLRGRMVGDTVPKLTYRCTRHHPGIIGHRHHEGIFVRIVAGVEVGKNRVAEVCCVDYKHTSQPWKAAMGASDHVREYAYGLIRLLWLDHPIKSIQ